MAAAAAVGFLFFLLLLLPPYYVVSSYSPYLSPTTFFQDYQQMLTSLKIFIYPATPKSSPIYFPEPAASHFYSSLVHSQFLTLNPSEAHLFFVPFSANTSPRSLSRIVRDLRNNYPYWNRTLGADHFFISPTGIDYSSDRNVLELKKNSVQISVFPVVSGNFVPHKDLSLPRFTPPILLRKQPEEESEFPQKNILGYLKWDKKLEPDLVAELKGDGNFLVEESESGESRYLQSCKRSKFCLFLYNDGEVAGMAEAMSVGCVPVLLVDRPIQDLPFMDVLRWSDMALLVAAGNGGDRLKKVLNGLSNERYLEMRELCVAASRHLGWEGPFDVFHVVMYQLWLRRHVIRYARRQVI